MVRPAPQGSMSLCERKSDKVTETGNLLISAPAPLKVETTRICSSASPQTETAEMAAPQLTLPTELISTGNRALRILISLHFIVRYCICNHQMIQVVNFLPITVNCLVIKVIFLMFRWGSRVWHRADPGGTCRWRSGRGGRGGSG